MRLTAKRLAVGPVLAFGILTLPATSPAQFQPKPANIGNVPTAQTQGVARPTFVNNSSTFVAPQMGYGGFPYTFQTPANGYLTGAASYTNAVGEYQNQIQSARLTQEQVKSAQLQNQRAAFDQMKYEQANTPTYEDIRQQTEADLLRRARNNPPKYEIWSGSILNSLLVSIQREQRDLGVPGPNVPIDPETLRRINVKTPNTRAGLSLFKDGGALQWPLPLRRPQFLEERENIDRLAPEAVKQAGSGQIAVETFDKLNENIKTIKVKVKNAVEDLSPSDYVLSMRFANQLGEGLQGLSSDDAKKIASSQWMPRGGTVAELVENMSRQGLTFGAATSGDENYYQILYQALLVYDAGLQQLARR